MLSVLIPSVTGKQGAYNWALNPSLVAMRRLKSGRLLKFLPMNDYEIEDLLKAVDHIQLLPIRKKNSTRALSPSISFVQRYHRKRLETAGSLIAQLLPKSIHAVTSQGFELKVALFVIASSLNSSNNSPLPLIVTVTSFGCISPEFKGIGNFTCVY